MLGDKLVTKIEGMIDWLRWPVNLLVLKSNSVVYGDNLRISGLCKIRNRGKITIGSETIITSRQSGNPVGGHHKTYLYVGKKGHISIGNNVGISNSVIFSLTSIIIEENVLIGGGVQIYDSDFHSLDPRIRTGRVDNDIKCAPILIKSNVFIGAGAIILKGVTIGEGSIIGAGSVVTKDVPQKEIWAGNPARKVSVV